MSVCGNERVDWLDGENIRPYVFVRKDNRIVQPGTRFQLDWFPKEILYFDPLKMKEASFADQILDLENKAFFRVDMPMPRWVFFDCAIMPGFIAGFAYRVKNLPDYLKEVLRIEEGREWVPLSLFISLPTLTPGEWVAHNLCSVNSLIKDKNLRLQGLGFLTKAFAFWFANIRSCYGMTQWGSGAMKLHALYGAFEVITAYTPMHSYAATLTYRLKVNPNYWSHFFTRDPLPDFNKKYKAASFEINPTDERSLIEFQERIEEGKEAYFLKPHDIRFQEYPERLKVYQRI